ncbi:Uncharacterised protein [uncultured archaeon]|nr:Uncharacterised protein [uncultured archaeon]
MAGLQEHDMRSMKESLQAYLSKTPAEEDDEEEEKGNDNKVKTYIVESNIDDPRRIEYWPLESKLNGTTDSNLWTVNIPTNSSDDLFLFLDTTDPRFWLFHTYGKSKPVQDFIDKLITQDRSKLDYSWFASNFLENRCNIGVGTGFGLKYFNSFLENTEEIEEKGLHRFSMLFWGQQPSQVLAGLKGNQVLVSGVALSRIKRIFKTQDGYVKENIHSNGQFTLTKGDSIDSHFLAVDKVKNQYSQLIEKIENNYRIQYQSTDSGFRIKGTYVVIEFTKKIENMGLFIKNFLSCTQPFRLFGIPRIESETFVKVAAVDLHTYDKFNMEITPESIRLFLDQESCGNVITRLMTNLQHYYDSQIVIKGCNDEQIL